MDFTLLSLTQDEAEAFDQLDAGSFASDASDNSQHWITLKNGEHVLIEGSNGSYQIVGGAGGNLNGNKVSPKHLQKSDSAKSSEALPLKEGHVQISPVAPIKRETEKAYLAEHNGKEHWLPKSHSSTAMINGQNHVIGASAWIMKEKGISQENGGNEKSKYISEKGHEALSYPRRIVGETEAAYRLEDYNPIENRYQEIFLPKSQVTVGEAQSTFGGEGIVPHITHVARFMREKYGMATLQERDKEEANQKQAFSRHGDLVEKAKSLGLKVTTRTKASTIRAKAAEAGVALDAAATAREIDHNGYVTIERNPISRAGIFQYSGRQISKEAEPDKIYNVYRPATELEHPEALESFKLVPLINDHTMLGNPDKQSGVVAPEKKGVEGTTGDMVEFHDGVLYANLRIFSQRLHDMIKRGKKDLSLGYYCKFVKQAGIHDGKPYDYVQTNLRGNHIALVENARCDVSVLDGFAFDSFDINFTGDTAMAEEKEKKEDKAEDRRMTKDEWEAESKKEKEAKDKAKDESEKEEKEKKEAEDKATKDKAMKDSEAKDAKAKDKKGKDEDDMDDSPADAGMDEAVLIPKFLAAIATRDALAKKLTPFIGVFDHSAMTASQVAEYGAKKIGLQVAPGQELAGLTGYLQGRTPPQTGYAFDSASTASGEIGFFKTHFQS